MATYAMMNGDVVSNIIIADNKEEAEKSLNCILIEFDLQAPASIGSTYDKNIGRFIPPKQFESWILNQETYSWEAPVKYPEDGLDYTWNEELTKWEIVNFIDS